MRLLTVLLLSQMAIVRAEYQGGSPHKAVVHLDETSFEDAIKDPANPLWFLKFYAPWYVP